MGRLESAPRLVVTPATAASPEVSADLASFFEVSLDLMCIRDMACRFTRVNKSWETVLGYSVKDLEGIAMLNLVHPDDAPATQAHMTRMETEDTVIGFVNRYRHRDGHYRHLEWRARRVGDKVYGLARDVTDRLAAEAQLAAATREAQAASQAKTDFLANMSHEIRTPLNGVIGLVGALRQTPLDPAQREIVDLIQQSGDSLVRIVSDILDVSKIEAGRLQIEALPFELRSGLETVLDAGRRAAAAKGLAFEVEYGEGVAGRYLGDVARIGQVLGNLLSNAVKFTDAGRVCARIAVTPPAAAGDAAWLALEVEDTGIGFSEAVGALLFQRFSQADATITRRFGGTGLGLSICRSLAETMGGRITARSEPDRGSLFQVFVPLAPLEASDATDAAFDAAALALVCGERGLRVLLAEDHPVNQRVVQLMLAPYGAEVTTVSNGHEAVEAFKAGAFDLVLMDMQMPVMDGLTATRAIRDLEAAAPQRARTPLAMLSANAMAEHRAQAAAAGADIHIAKPLTVESFMGGIGQVLAAAAG